MIVKGYAMKMMQSVKSRDQLGKISMIFKNFGMADNCIRINNKTTLRLDDKVYVKDLNF